VGAFAYSQGLEAAVAHGDVQTGADLEIWLRDSLAAGPLRLDAVILALVLKGEDPRELNDLGLALAPSRERRLEMVQQGAAFREAWRGGWAGPTGREWPVEAEIAYPVAVGLAARANALDPDWLLPSWLTAALGTQISAAIRLSVIGQMEGQSILARLAPAILETAKSAQIATADDLASGCPGADCASIAHATLEGRLFRS